METTSWLDYFAFLRVDYEMDFEGATVAAVEDGNVPANVPRSDGLLTTTGGDIQDERLPFPADDTLAAYNDGGSGTSGTSSTTHFSAGGNASDIQPSSLLKEDEDGPSLAEETEIMASRGESDAVSAERAYRLLDAERRAKCISCGDGDEALSLLTKATAAALLSWIRCKTDGNGLVITDDGGVATSDTAERQKLWAAHTPTVLKLLAEVGKEPSSDPEVGLMSLSMLPFTDPVPSKTGTRLHTPLTPDPVRDVERFLYYYVVGIPPPHNPCPLISSLHPVPPS